MSRRAWTQWEVLPGGLFVFYGGPGRFDDETYDRWYQALGSSGVRRYLGATANGFQITGAQRHHGRSFFLDNNVCFATVTDDPLVRGFVTAAKWFGINIAAFSWQQLDDATASLGLDLGAAERAKTTLLRLRAAVDSRQPVMQSR
jgi:hypothetical protein